MDRYYYQELIIPAGTPVTAPVSQIWALEDNYLKYIDYLVPPGPSGEVGFRVLWAAQQVIPWGNNSFLISDNEEKRIDCDFMMTLTGLVLQGYNTGTYPHTIYFRGLIQTATIAEQLEAQEITGSIAVPGSQVTADTMTGIPAGVGVYDTGSS